MSIVCSLGILILGLLIISKSQGSLLGKYDAVQAKPSRSTLAGQQVPQQPVTSTVPNQAPTQPADQRPVNPLGDIYDII